MPLKNGIQVVQEVRAYYQLRQKERPGQQIAEPQFVFLTAFKTHAFYKHLIALNITECYEKPI